MPRLTAAMIRSNPPNSIATALGHLDRQRQHAVSTKALSPPTPASNLPFKPTAAYSDSPPTFDDTTLPAPDLPDDAIYTWLLKTDEASHSDLTGRLPFTSRRGTQYLHISVWKNYAHIEPQRSKSAADHVASYNAALRFFKDKGNVRITVQRLDNETSSELDTFLRSHVDIIEYVPPDHHRANKAERTIRAVKNHIIASLCPADPAFPLNLFDAVLPQIELTLNLLRPFGPNPSISAYEGLHRTTYDFLQHPLAPIGTRVVIYESPDKRASWAPHGVKGFYLGPALDHHRTYRTWATATQHERLTATVA